MDLFTTQTSFLHDLQCVPGDSDSSPEKSCLSECGFWSLRVGSKTAGVCHFRLDGLNHVFATLFLAIPHRPPYR
jgi:hypothetical protein